MVLRPCPRTGRPLRWRGSSVVRDTEASGSARATTPAPTCGPSSSRLHRPRSGILVLGGVGVLDDADRRTVERASVVSAPGPAVRAHRRRGRAAGPHRPRRRPRQRSWRPHVAGQPGAGAGHRPRRGARRARGRTPTTGHASSHPAARRPRGSRAGIGRRGARRTRRRPAALRRPPPGGRGARPSAQPPGHRDVGARRTDRRLDRGRPRRLGRGGAHRLGPGLPRAWPAPAPAPATSASPASSWARRRTSTATSAPAPRTAARLRRQVAAPSW